MYKYIDMECVAFIMHGDIALNGCECMVEKISTLCLVFDWVGLVKWDEV